MNQITAGRTRYINERRSLEWSNSIGLQLPKEGAKRDEHPAHALPIGLQLPKGRNQRGDNVIVRTEADLFKANSKSPELYSIRPTASSNHDVINDLPQILNTLTKRLEDLGLSSKIALNVMDSILIDGGGNADGSYFNGLIKIAMDGTDAAFKRSSHDK